MHEGFKLHFIQKLCLPPTADNLFDMSLRMICCVSAHCFRLQTRLRRANSLLQITNKTAWCKLENHKRIERNNLEQFPGPNTTIAPPDIANILFAQLV